MLELANAPIDLRQQALLFYHPDGYCLMVAESKGQRAFVRGIAQARAERRGA